MLSQKDNEFISRIGAGTAMGTYLRRFWTPLMLSTDLAEPDGTPQEARIYGEDVVAFRDSSGRVGVLQANVSKHLGTELSSNLASAVIRYKQAVVSRIF